MTQFAAICVMGICVNGMNLITPGLNMQNISPIAST